MTAPGVTGAPVDVLAVMDDAINNILIPNGGAYVESMEEARDVVAELIAERDALRKGLEAVAAVIDNSDGVNGLHLNGDLATWASLRTGGRFESWLLDFDAALASVGGA